MKYIQLGGHRKKPIQGYAIVSDNDFIELNKYKWHISGGYAVREGVNKNGRRKRIKMHRTILNIKKKEYCDHINGDKLDNRRENLRVCTNQQNQRNSKKHIDSKSKYKGIRFHHGKWEVRVSIDKNNRIHRYFDSKLKAVTAYNKIVKKYHGEFARLISV